MGNAKVPDMFKNWNVRLKLTSKFLLIKKEGEELEPRVLTPVRVAVLAILIRAAKRECAWNRFVTPKELRTQLRKFDHDLEPENVVKHIFHIRELLATVGLREILVTVPHAGYRLAVAPENLQLDFDES